MKFHVRSALVLTFLATLISHRSGLAQTNELVSVSTGAVQGNNDSGGASITPDGRFVVFNSSASNLVPNDTNSLIDAFVHDRQTGVTERVSVSSAGAEAFGAGYPHSYGGPISADGRYVVFTTKAPNLVAGDTNNVEDVFVRDRQNSTTQRVSVDNSGAQGTSPCGGGSISADGHFVAIETDSILVAGATGHQIYVRDLTSATNEIASLSWSGVKGNSYSSNACISGDGRFVVFVSLASNLVPGDTNGFYDVFVRDRLLSTTTRVSVDSLAGQSNGNSLNCAISADGGRVSFLSEATNLVPGDTNARNDVFVHDLANGTTQRASLNFFGTQWGFHSSGGAISNDGRFVGFNNEGALVGGSAFLRDLQSQTSECVSLFPNGYVANGSVPALSNDGRYALVTSTSPNLVPGDSNGFVDVFVRDRGPLPSSYCTASTSSSDCSAMISANLNPSASLAQTCRIGVTNVEGQKSGLLFYGIDNSAFAPVLWATGSTSYLCVKQPTNRTPIQNSGGTLNACDGSYLLNWNSYQYANPFALGNPWSVGAKVYVQAWFRDPLAVKSTNLSNAVEITYGP